MRLRWDRVFTQTPDRFGNAPSIPATLAAQTFERLNLAHAAVLDLGAGTGRDTLFFASRGMPVTALDFSAVALDALRRNAQSLGLSGLQTVEHDVRTPLPYPDASFDACYAHMLYCMDFTSAELAALAAEALRILKPGGIHVYTVRTTADPDYGIGIHRGEGLYEDDGFIVHFFDRAMVDRLAAGFELLDVTTFEEGALPRRLFCVTMRKPPADT